MMKGPQEVFAELSLERHLFMSKLSGRALWGALWEAAGRGRKGQRCTRSDPPWPEVARLHQNDSQPTPAVDGGRLHSCPKMSAES